MGQYIVETATLELTAEYFEGNVVPENPTKAVLRTAMNKLLDDSAFVNNIFEFDTLEESKAYFERLAKSIERPELIGRRTPYWTVDIIKWGLYDPNDVFIILKSTSSIDKSKRPQPNALRKFLRIPLDISMVSDANIIEWLNQQPNRNGYIRDLILADMKKNGHTT